MKHLRNDNKSACKNSINNSCPFVIIISKKKRTNLLTNKVKQQLFKGSINNAVFCRLYELHAHKHTL